MLMLSSADFLKIAFLKILSGTLVDLDPNLYSHS